MDIIFALIGFCLITEFFYFARNLGKPIPLSKTDKLIVGLIGLAGTISMLLILRTDMIPSRFNKVILPTFGWAFPDWAVGFTLLAGTITNLIFLFMGIFGKVASNDVSTVALEVSSPKSVKSTPDIPATNDDTKETKNNVALEIHSKGAFVVVDSDVSILLDNVLIGSGSFVKGFTLQVLTIEGVHKLDLKYSVRITSMTLDVEKDKNYRVDIQYSRAWGKLKMTCSEIAKI